MMTDVLYPTPSLKNNTFFHSSCAGNLHNTPLPRADLRPRQTGHPREKSWTASLRVKSKTSESKDAAIMFCNFAAEKNDYFTLTSCKTERSMI